jgi:hypothetical protein
MIDKHLDLEPAADRGRGAYPVDREAAVALHDGSIARVRPVRPEDEARLLAFLRSLSDGARRLRFFSLGTDLASTATMRRWSTTSTRSVCWPPWARTTASWGMRSMRPPSRAVLRSPSLSPRITVGKGGPRPVAGRLLQYRGCAGRRGPGCYRGARPRDRGGRAVWAKRRADIVGAHGRLRRGRARRPPAAGRALTSLSHHWDACDRSQWSTPARGSR